MEERRYFWVFERNPLDYLRLPEFTLLEGVLIVGSLVGLALYVMLIVYLDGLEKGKARRAKQMAWLERWLKHLQLNPQEEAALDLLAGGGAPKARYELLSSPIRLETRVHEAISAGQPIPPAFAENLRDKLGYTSQNLRVPVVSTRQLVTGDPVRISFSSGGMPHHYYGKVAAQGSLNFAVDVHADAVKSLAEAGGEADLFYIRALGLEYPFVHAAARPGKNPEQLVLRHMLAREHQAPRAARLPVMQEVAFRPHDIKSSPVDDLDPDKVRPAEGKGLLLDISTGGFCLGHVGELEVGLYIELRLPLKQGRQALTLIGRIKASRPFTRDQWLTRCEIRGMDAVQRKLLAQILRRGQNNRLRMLMPIRGNAAKAG